MWMGHAVCQRKRRPAGRVSSRREVCNFVSRSILVYQEGMRSRFLCDSDGLNSGMLRHCCEATQCKNITCSLILEHQRKQKNIVVCDAEYHPRRSSLLCSIYTFCPYCTDRLLLLSKQRGTITLAIAQRPLWFGGGQTISSTCPQPDAHEGSHGRLVGARGELFVSID